MKNYRVYLKEILPDEIFTIEDASTLAACEWNELNDTDYTKRYFKILEKITEENRQITFIDNDDYIDTTRTIEKGLKWKEVNTPDTLNIPSVQSHSNSTRAIKRLTIEDIDKTLEELKINDLSDLLHDLSIKFTQKASGYNHH